MDIMAATGEQMEAGYKKIYKWCQFEFRQFIKEGHLEVSPVLKEVVRRLRSRLVMLQWVLFPTFSRSLYALTRLREIRLFAQC